MKLTWQDISESEVLTLAAAQKGQTKISPVHAGGFRKTSISVPAGERLELPTFTPLSGFSLIEINVLRDAELAFSLLQNDAALTGSITWIRVTLEERAALNSAVAILGGVASTLVLETELKGEGSHLMEQTIFFADGKETFDIFSNAQLFGKSCVAEVDSRGILAGAAQVRFDGNIRITQTAKGARARLNEHTLLLSNEAKMNAIPGLNIETNDVFANHAASMTRVDEEQLFYAAARGVSEKEATRAIAEGFLRKLYADFGSEREIEKSITQKLAFV